MHNCCLHYFKMAPENKCFNSRPFTVAGTHVNRFHSLLAELKLNSCFLHGTNVHIKCTYVWFYLSIVLSSLFWGVLPEFGDIYLWSNTMELNGTLNLVLKTPKNSE